jgi:hypothetical protein
MFTLQTDQSLGGKETFTRQRTRKATPKIGNNHKIQPVDEKYFTKVIPFFIIHWKFGFTLLPSDFTTDVNTVT